MMYKKILPLLLAVALLLSACGTVRTQPGEAPAANDAAAKIAYVPLDDRPNNYECMVYMAQSLDYELIMPPLDDFSTRLDGQPGTQTGDRAAIYDWLVSCENDGCDRYIIFVDQLVSGGLCASRSGDINGTVTLSDGSVVTETELLEMTLELLRSDDNNRVWLLDSVMRLAPTIGYDGYTADDYNGIRAYFALPRLALSGDKLTVSDITAAYGLDENGNAIPIPEGYTAADNERFIEARERKLLLSDELLRLVSDDDDIFTVLYGIDDSSVSNCAQTNEIAYIESLLREGDELLSGVDDMGFKALCSIYLEEINWQGAEAEVRYFGGAEGENACQFDYHPLNELVTEHMDYFGLAEKTGAELKICVLTKPADADKGTEYCDELIDYLNACLESDMPVILLDASNSAYGDYFQTRLVEDTELGKLIAYAGLLDLANLTGTGLSHGVARYAYLKNGEGTELSEYGHMCSLADVLIHDICYRDNVRPLLASYIKDELMGDPNNLYATETDPELVNDKLAELMSENTKKLIEKLECCNFISSLSPYAERGWGGIELSGLKLPWYRTFEISFELKAGSSTEPHENVFGVYYK